MHLALLSIRIHRPQFDRRGTRTRTSIGHIKDIMQAGMFLINIQQANARAASFDVALHPFVPEFVGSTSRGIRALRMNQELIVV